MSRQSSRLADWFGELRGPLRRFLSRRRGVPPADLDDIAQEVFLRLLRYDRQELAGAPKSYLFTVASNVAHDWSARPTRRLPHEAQWLEDLREEVEPDAELERELRARELRAALQNLTPRSREIVRLHFGEGLTHEDIAKTLAVTPRVVKRELIRAYSMLRNELETRGIHGLAGAEMRSIGKEQ